MEQSKKQLLFQVAFQWGSGHHLFLLDGIKNQVYLGDVFQIEQLKETIKDVNSLARAGEKSIFAKADFFRAQDMGSQPPDSSRARPSHAISSQ